ncbi:hypothetical protein MMYC01_209553 [Madurella mycetomatis]|uniref:Uncharacterized protein n=1 Tax=Madurella mycetomatis TaxID=100816 RepID=A0A175VRP1_9PEZI|nr:hypothetical protein MMYC01_209553 [Madurella mycetomatis]
MDDGRLVTVSQGPLATERDLQRHTGSDSTFDTIAGWIKECEHHLACRLPASSPSFLPTHLIFVGTVSSPSLYLVNTLSDLLFSPRSTPTRYIAFSHFWGDNIPDTLTARTLPLMREHIPDPPLIRDLFYWRVELAPLTGRAWAFQERLLARRVVHFWEGVASELHVRGARYEAEPYVVRDGRLVRWIEDAVLGPLRNRMLGRDGDVDDMGRAAVRGIRGALDMLQSLGPVSRQSFREKIQFYKRWYEMVSAYSQGQLTRQSNKLVALAGVAELV